MKPSNTLLVAILFALCSSVFGQEEQGMSIRKNRVTDIYIQTGFFSQNDKSGTLEDFKRIASQSVLLSNDFKGYSKIDGNFSSAPKIIVGMFSVVVGIKFHDPHKEPYKNTPQLRLGFSYLVGSILSCNLYKSDIKEYDSILSPQTGQMMDLDSIKTNTYHLSYTSQQLRFDGSIIFRTNQNARLSLYSGFGITAGLSLNAYTDIYSHEFYFIETGIHTSSLSQPIDAEEKTRVKNNVGISLYVPLAVDFRLGKKNETLKRIHFFYEFRPGFNFTSIPELRTLSHASLQQGFGIRIQIVYLSQYN